MMAQVGTNCTSEQKPGDGWVTGTSAGRINRDTFHDILDHFDSYKARIGANGSVTAARQICHWGESRFYEDMLFK